MPGPYTPQHTRRTQAVRRPRRGGAIARGWRWWWIVPLAGLIPLLLAVVATQGLFARGSGGTPVASGPTTAALTVVTTTTSVATATTAPTSTPVASPTAASATSPVAASAPTTSPTSPATTTTSTTTSTTTTTTTGQPTTATPTSGATSSPSAAAQPFVAYHVQAGDTLRFIARTYGVSVASIAQASGLANPDRLRVGQLLTIPSAPGWLYRVQPGETLDQIAARSGVTADVIASTSGLTAASVRSGDVLLIPDQTVTLAQGK